MLVVGLPGPGWDTVVVIGECVVVGVILWGLRSRWVLCGGRIVELEWRNVQSAILVERRLVELSGGKVVLVGCCGHVGGWDWMGAGSGGICWIGWKEYGVVQVMDLSVVFV